MRYEDGTLYIQVPNDEILEKIDRVIIEVYGRGKEFVQHDEEWFCADGKRRNE